MNNILKDNLTDNIYDGFKNNNHISSFWNSRIIIKNHYTGNVILETKNKLILPGSGLIAHKVFDISGTSIEDEITPSYNNKITGIENPTTTAVPDPSVVYTNANANNHKIILFCLGNDGCGNEASQVYSVNYKKWCAPNNLIPFIYTENDDEIDRELYYGKTNFSNGKIGYYFKRFNQYTINNGINFYQVYENGTPITQEVYDNNNPEEIYTYAEMKMSITEDECVQYMSQVIGSQKVNTIQLCTAYPVINKDTGSTGYDKIYMKDIRPITKFNFSNEILTGNKSIDITYQVYF